MVISTITICAMLLLKNPSSYMSNPNNHVLLTASGSENVTNLVVTKTETIQVNVMPDGTIEKPKVTINIIIQNLAETGTRFDFLDRIEMGIPETLSLLLDTPTPETSYEHDVFYLNWTDIEIDGLETYTLDYTIESNKMVPINVSVAYYVDGEHVNVSSDNKISVPEKSNLTCYFTLANNHEGYFLTEGPQNPMAFALISANLPSETIGDITSNPPPLLEADVSLLRQVTWFTLLTENSTVFNWTAPIESGGGWGIIELEPLSITITQSKSMTDTVTGGVSALLGSLMGIEGFWSYFVVESIIDQLSLLDNVMELFVDMLMGEMGVMDTIMYSALGNIDFTAGTEAIFTSLEQNSSLFSLFKLDYLLDFLEGVDDDQFGLVVNTKSQITGIVEQVKTGLVASIGAQIISLLGSPVNITIQELNRTQRIWNSSSFMGYELTDAIISNDLDQNNIPEILLALYNSSADESIIVALEYDKDTSEYVQVWNSTQSPNVLYNIPPLGSTTINGRINQGCLKVGDLDEDDDREIIVGTTHKDLIVFEWTNELLTHSFDYLGGGPLYRRHNLQLSDTSANVSSVLAPDTPLNSSSKSLIFGLMNGTIILADVGNMGGNHAALSITTNWHKDMQGTITDISVGNTDADSFPELIFRNESMVFIYENITDISGLSDGLQPLWNLSNSMDTMIAGYSNGNGKSELIAINGTHVNVTEAIVSTNTTAISPTVIVTYETLEGYNESLWNTKYSSSIDNSTNFTNVAIGDMNENGLKEIITANENGSIFIYENINQENYHQILEFTDSAEFGSSGFCLGDVNDDNHPEFILLGNDSRVHVIERLFPSIGASINIYANLTRDPIDNMKTDLYTRINVSNLAIDLFGGFAPLTINQQYVYDGDGPQVIHVATKFSENYTTESKKSVIVNHTLRDTPNSVEGIWEDGVGTDKYNPDGTYSYLEDGKTNLTLGSGQEFTYNNTNVTVNYTAYVLVDPIYGYNLTTFPPYDYVSPGTGSTFPAIYPFLVEQLQTSTSSLFKFLGNLTSSVVKLYMLLNATITEIPTLSGGKPITFRSGFSPAGLVQDFSLFQPKETPFGTQGAGVASSDLGVGFGMDSSFAGMTGQFGMGDMNETFSDFYFDSLLQIFLNPSLAARFVYNFTIDGNFTNFADPIFLPNPENIVINSFDLSDPQAMLDMFNEGIEVLGNYTEKQNVTSSLDFTPILLEDINNDGYNDTLVGINGFYPYYQIFAISGQDNSFLWNFTTRGAVVSMTTNLTSKELVVVTNDADYNFLNETSNILYKINLTDGSIIDGKNGVQMTCNESLNFFYGNDASYIGDPMFSIQDRDTYEVSFKPLRYDSDNFTIFTFLNEMKGFQASSSGNDVVYDVSSWTYDALSLIQDQFFVDLDGDGIEEIVISTASGHVFAINKTGSEVWRYKTKSIIRGIEIGDINKDTHPDIIVGCIDGTIHAIDANGTRQWTHDFTGNLIHDVTLFDFNDDGDLETIVSGSDYCLHAINRTGDLIWTFNSSNNLALNNSVTIDSVNLAILNTTLTAVFGASDNVLYFLNITNNTAPSYTQQFYLGNQITTFQMYRTNETISLQYNLPDNIISMLGSLTSTNFESMLSDLQSGFDFDLSMGALSGLDFMGMGMDSSMLQFGQSFNLSELIDLNNFTIGIGLLNLILSEAEYLIQLQDWSTLSRTQREYTGKCDVIDTGVDVSYQTTNRSNGNVIWYDITNEDMFYDLRVNYFSIMVNDSGDAIDWDRIQFLAWNGTDYVDLMNNSIYNITLDTLDITMKNVQDSSGLYNHTEIRFRPFLTVPTEETKNITLDWLGRPIFLNISGSYNLSCWSDVSIILPSVTYVSVTSTYTTAVTYPLIIVFDVGDIYIPPAPYQPNILEEILTNPIFYFILIAITMMFLEVAYLYKRDRFKLHKKGSKNVINWLKRREKGWEILAQNGILYPEQVEVLKRFKLRIQREMKESSFVTVIREKLPKRQFIYACLRTFFLFDYIRDTGKRSRLAIVMDSMVDSTLVPIQKGLVKFLTALQHILMGKSKKAKLLEQLEREKRERTPDEALVSKKKGDKITSKSKKKLETDGGVLNKRIQSVKKRLPNFYTPEGKVFYTLSKNRFIGTTMEQLSKELKIPIIELLPTVIRLYEKGLLILLQEGDSIADDLWDIASTLRKQDPDIEKIIYSMKTLEESLTETLAELLTNKKICPKCGTTIEENETKCSKCGEEIKN